jgi:hypothetical protein
MARWPCCSRLDWRVLADLALLGIFGGFYIVPLYALIQSAPSPRMLRASSPPTTSSMRCSWWRRAFGSGPVRRRPVHPAMLLARGAVCNAAVAMYIYGLVPEFLHALHRLDADPLGVPAEEARGLEQVPEEGAAVIVCNHVSFVDALVIMAACRRPIRFVMDHQIFRWPLLNFVFREGRAIPIASAKEDPAMMERPSTKSPKRSMRRPGRHLPRGQDHRQRRDQPVPPRHHAHPAAQRRCRWCRWRCAACGAASSRARTVRR